MDELKEKIPDVFAKFDKFLEGQDFWAGNEMSIADFQLYCEMTDVDFNNTASMIDNYPNIKAWRARCAETKGIKEVHNADFHNLLPILHGILKV